MKRWNLCNKCGNFMQLGDDNRCGPCREGLVDWPRQRRHRKRKHWQKQTKRGTPSQLQLKVDDKKSAERTLEDYRQRRKLW